MYRVLILLLLSISFTNAELLNCEETDQLYGLYDIKYNPESRYFTFSYKSTLYLEGSFYEGEDTVRGYFPEYKNIWSKEWKYLEISNVRYKKHNYLLYYIDHSSSIKINTEIICYP